MRAALIAALSTIALFPSAAFAQQACEQHNNQVAGTIFGTVAGAAIGNAVAGHGDKKSGAIIGALGGAILGNQLSKPKNVDCSHAYGFYDTNGAWHANPVDRTAAQGFYDRNGGWVDGAPNGYYDDRGVWVVAQTNARAGYYDDGGHWVPPAVNGYYDPNNRWVAVTDVSVRGDARRDDRRDDFNRGWDNRPQNARQEVDWLRQRINRAKDDGRINRRQARDLLSDLQRISDREARMPHRGGDLNYNDQKLISAQLEEVTADLRRETRS